MWKTQIVAVTIELVYTPESVEATKQDVAGSSPMPQFDNFDDDIPF